MKIEKCKLQIVPPSAFLLPPFRNGFAALFCFALLLPTTSTAAAAPKTDRTPRVAAIVTAYYHNSHADVIVTRILESHTLDGKGKYPNLKLASLYMDQIPKNDIGTRLAKKHNVPIFKSVADALTLGTDKLAVDGVLLIAEHGDYPESDSGQIVYPKRRLFSQIIKVFDESDRVVPVFCDKHLADNWKDAKWIYDEAARRKIPLMAGSSLPGLWRYPAIDARRGEKIKEIVAISYHRLDTYGFHALEMVQCLAERRAGGETGVKRVQCLTGDAVWEAGKRGVYNQELFRAALACMKLRPVPQGKKIEELAREPALFVVDYNDGLRASVVTLNHFAIDWTVAWRAEGEKQIKSTAFWTQEYRPFEHFGFLLSGVEKMVHSGRPTWPAERTLLTSGVLDALHISKKQGGKWLATPHLDVKYQSRWDWRAPPPPLPKRK